MKRLISHEKVQWLYKGKQPHYNTMITFDTHEIPEDLDLTGYHYSVCNLLWDNCYGKVTRFDDLGNIIKLRFPNYFKKFAFAVRKQTYENQIAHISKQMNEDECIVKGEKIWYDNFIGSDIGNETFLQEAINTAWNTCRTKGFEPNIGSKELVQHILKFLQEKGNNK